MDESLRFLRLRDPLDLDDGTVDRLLDGMPADDAPPRYRDVARLLSALKAAPTAAETAGERQAVAAVRVRESATAASAHQQASRRGKRRLRLTGAALVGSATLFLGLGAAGALPGAAQSVASDMLGTVGVSTPNPDSHAGTHADERGRSGGAGTTSADAADSGEGGTITTIAHDDSTTGVDKGAAVSTEASDGESQAGEHGNASESQSNAGNAGQAPANGGPPAEPDNGNSQAGTVPGQDRRVIPETPDPGTDDEAKAKKP